MDDARRRPSRSLTVASPSDPADHNLISNTHNKNGPSASSSNTAASRPSGFDPRFSQTLPSRPASLDVTGGGGRRPSIASNDPTLNRSDPYAPKRRRSSAVVAPGGHGLAASPVLRVDTAANPTSASPHTSSPAGYLPAATSPLRPANSPLSYQQHGGGFSPRAYTTSSRASPLSGSSPLASLSRSGPLPSPSSGTNNGGISAGRTEQTGRRRSSAAASLSQVEVDHSRRPSVGPETAEMAATGGKAPRSFVPIEDVISGDFAAEYPTPFVIGVPPKSTPLPLEAPKQQQESLEQKARNEEQEAAIVVTQPRVELEERIKHSSNGQLGWRDMGSFTCMMATPPESHGFCPYWLSFSKTGKFLVSGGHDGHVKVWNTMDMSCHRDYTGHTSIVLQCSFLGDDDKYIISTATEEVIVWYMDAPRGLSNIRFSIGNLKGVSTIAVSPNTQTLVIAGQSRVISVWDLAGCMTVAETSKAPRFAAEECSFRSHVLPSKPETGHTDRIVRAAFAPDSVHLLTCSFDKTIILWDVRKHHGQPVRVYQGHKDHVLGLSWHEGGQMFASASHDGVVLIWRMDMLVPIHVLTGHESIVYACQYLPKSNRLLTLSNDIRMILWNTRTGSRVKSIEHVQRGVKPCLAIDQLGLRLAVAANDKERPITLWKVERPPPKWRPVVKLLCCCIPEASVSDAASSKATPAQYRFELPSIEARDKAEKAKIKKQNRKGMIALSS